MSRIFEALQQYQAEAGRGPVPGEVVPGFPIEPGGEPDEVSDAPFDLDQVISVETAVTPRKHLVALTDPAGVGAEKLRQLTSRLRQHQRRAPDVKVLLITSSVRGEGKSLLSVNLAVTLAQQKQRTILIDADLRSGTLCSVLGLDRLPGLTDWFHAGGDVRAYMRRIGSLPLWLLPSGTASEQPLKIIESPKTQGLIQQARQQTDWIIIDSAPLPPFADSGLLATASDGVLVVVRQGVTPKKLFQKCLESLDRAKVLGLVLNDATGIENSYYRKYYKPR